MVASGERRAAIRHANRAGGQVAALAGMIAAEDRFPEIAQQLLAARGSLDSLLLRLIELELGECLPSQELRGVVDSLLRTALGRAASARGTTGLCRRRPTATNA
jgi:DNA-binding FrmR family transcriptional regulator